MYRRSFIYTAIFAGIGLAMLIVLAMRETLDVNVLRDRNPLFVTLSDGSTRNGYEVKILNMRGETRQFWIETRGLLLKLEQCGVLDNISREMVITQLMALGAETIELEHVKWVILMVLSNYTDGEGVSELTEMLVLDGLHSCIH